MKKTRNRLKKDLKNLHKIKNLYSKYIKVQRLKQQSLGLESFGTNQARWWLTLDRWIFDRTMFYTKPFFYFYTLVRFFPSLFRRDLAPGFILNRLVLLVLQNATAQLVLSHFHVMGFENIAPDQSCPPILPLPPSSQTVTLVEINKDKSNENKQRLLIQNLL